MMHDAWEIDREVRKNSGSPYFYAHPEAGRPIRNHPKKADKK